MRDFKPIDYWDWYYCYTCNAPSDNQLQKNNIKKVWEDFWILANEVLSIPKKLFKKLWLFHRSSEEAQINSEKICRILSSK